MWQNLLCSNRWHQIMVREKRSIMLLPSNSKANSGALAQTQEPCQMMAPVKKHCNSKSEGVSIVKTPHKIRYVMLFEKF